MSESTPIYSSMADSKPLYQSDEPVPSIETGSNTTNANLENAKNTVINSMVGFASTSGVARIANT